MFRTVFALITAAVSAEDADAAAMLQVNVKKMENFANWETSQGLCTTSDGVKLQGLISSLSASNTTLAKCQEASSKDKKSPGFQFRNQDGLCRVFTSSSLPATTHTINWLDIEWTFRGLGEDGATAPIGDSNDNLKWTCSSKADADALLQVNVKKVEVTEDLKDLEFVGDGMCTTSDGVKLQGLISSLSASDTTLAKCQEASSKDNNSPGFQFRNEDSLCRVFTSSSLPPSTHSINWLGVEWEFRGLGEDGATADIGGVNDNLKWTCLRKA